MELQLIPPYAFMVSLRLTSYFLPFTVHFGKHISQSEMTDLTLTAAQEYPSTRHHMSIKFLTSEQHDTQERK